MDLSIVRERLLQVVISLTVIIGVFGLAFLGLGTVFSNTVLLIVSSIMGVNALICGFMWYGYDNYTNTTVVWSIGASLLFSTIMLALIQPVLSTGYMFTPLIVAITGLQYISNEQKGTIVVTSISSSIVAFFAGLFSPFKEYQVLSWFVYLNAAVIIGIFIIIGFLLWQFNQRLISMIDSITESNAALALKNEVLLSTNGDLKKQIELEKQLREQIADLEVPITELAHDVIYAPIVGHLDDQRIDTFREALLKRVHEQRARAVVLDVTSIAHIDTYGCGLLTQTIQTVKLLGTQVILCGISASMAMILTNLGISFGEDLRVARSPSDAMHLLGVSEKQLMVG
ncbi:MAG: STAS domain-containing protein [Chloroflexi bacterium]|nr:STAS domain-containing protein [Chloroflexota bacterium]